MGLDTVELVVAFEEAFGIEIPDHVAEQLTTPRKVTDYVLCQLKLVEYAPCMSQQAFYLLRRNFIPILGIPRAEFRPATSLRTLIPIENRIQTWARIRSEIGVLAVPDLVRPNWLFFLLSALTLLTAIDLFIHLANVFESGQVAFFLSLLIAGVLAYGSAVLTRPLKREFQMDCAAAGDLAKYLSLHTPHVFKKEWTREQVATSVRKVIVDVTGVRNFTDDSRFVEDLHLD